MSESFLQHAEHYARILGAAQAPQMTQQRRDDADVSDAEQESDAELDAAEAAAQGFAVIGGDDEGRTDIVDTPEEAAADRRARRRRGPEGSEEEEDAPRRRRRPQRRPTRGAAESGDGLENGVSEEAKVARPRDVADEPAGAANIEQMGGAAS